MTTTDMLSINNVAAKLGLSVHQLRRWELMFGLEIKRGRGQQRQYREEDLSVLERIKELVEQGWPTSQIRPQLEAEGLVTPKLIGVPPPPGNPEVLQESIIGLRNFTERRFIEISKQIDELRQLLISVTLKQELSTDKGSPWQPMASEYVPAPKVMPAQEITIGPQISIDPPASTMRPPNANMAMGMGQGSSMSRPIIGSTPQPRPTDSQDALSRSMSAVNSLFSEPGSKTAPGTGAGSGSAASASPQDNPTAPKPVRFSTIPPLPSELAAMEEQLVGTAIPSPTTEIGDDMIVPPSHPSVLSDVLPPAQTAAPAGEAIAESALVNAEEIQSPPPTALPSAETIDLTSLTPDNPIFSPQRLESIPPLPPNPFKMPLPEVNNFNPPTQAQETEETAHEPVLEATPSEFTAQRAEQNMSLNYASMQSFAPGQGAVQQEDSFEAEPDFVEAEAEPEFAEAEPAPNLSQPIALTPGPQVNFGPNVAAPTPQAAPQRVDDNFGLGEVTDQNYLTVLGRALDLIGWTDEQADSYSLKTFGIPHWDELGRSQAEKLVAHLIALLKEQMGQ